MAAGAARWRVALTAPLLAAFVAIAAAEAVPPTQQYLIPLMWHGPNNQIVAIKETLSLARLLGRTTLLPDLQSHSFTDSVEENMAFEDLFDLPYIRSKADVRLLREVNISKIDAALLLVPPSKVAVDRLARGLGFTPPPQDLWLQSPVTAWSGCAEHQLDALKSLLLPHKFVLVQTFHGLLFGSQWLAGPLPVACSDACCQAFKETSTLVRKSPVLYDMAAAFARNHLAGKPYVAAHVRPYPDACVRVWTQEDTPERVERMDRLCNNEYLLPRFVPSIKYLLERYQTTTAFVMTHPQVRGVVQNALRDAGVNAVFMDLDHVKVLATAHAQAAGGKLSTNISFSLLAMVEEAVCVHAKAFVGTKESSMTGTIIQDRIGHQHALNASYCFFRRKGYEAMPIDMGEFYQRANWSMGGSDRWRAKLVEHGVARGSIRGR